MADKFSNVSAGVDSGRQASAASGAGGGRTDDKRDGRKRCYHCNRTGHLQKDCPLLAAMSMRQQLQLQQQQPVTSGQPRDLAGPEPSRCRQHRPQRGQEDVPPQRENQLDPSGENGADQQKDQQQNGQ